MKMSQVHADVERFVQPLPLEEYRAECGEHLQYIEHGAGMICRRVAMMTRQPGFRTMAADEIERAELVLEQSLAKIRAAKVAFEQKPMERA